MLIGEYIHTIDDKNRLSLPVKFRKEMGKSIVVTRGLDNCLFVYTIKEWEKISAQISEASFLQSDTRSFNRFIFSGAQQVDVDSIGRVLIPDFLRDYASLKTKAVVIGVHSRVEIWDEKTWNKYKGVVEKQADALAEKLGSVGVL